MPGRFGEREHKLIPVRRVVAGVLLTSILLPVLVVLVGSVVVPDGAMIDPSQFLKSEGPRVLVNSFLAALTPTIFLGLPLHAFYRRLGWCRVAQYLDGGALAGLVYCLVLRAVIADGDILAFAVFPYMFLGAVAASYQWRK
jgi:fumarate reductase subunit D